MSVIFGSLCGLITRTQKDTHAHVAPDSSDETCPFVDMGPN